MEAKGQHHAPDALSPGKNLLVPTNRRPGGFRSRYGQLFGKQKSSGLAGFEHQAFQPVAESVFRLRYSGSS
jgi:hypothetical protein